MKKFIQVELENLAHKILQLDPTSGYADLAAIAGELHEKLAVLAYVEKLEYTAEPIITVQQIEDQIAQDSISNSTFFRVDSETKNVDAVPKKESQLHDSQPNTYNDKYRPDGTQFNEEPPVHEPVIEKIKDMWPEMNPEATAIDKVIDTILPNTPSMGKNDSFEIGNEYHTPIFEPKESRLENSTEKKSKNLNDSLKKGKFKIGLNDKLSFIKHLFNGSSSDYNRVLSQLETFQSFDEAQQFIEQIVKLDYENWEGKEVQEERFIQIIESRYS